MIAKDLFTTLDEWRRIVFSTLVEIMLKFPQLLGLHNLFTPLERLGLASKCFPYKCTMGFK